MARPRKCIAPGCTNLAWRRGLCRKDLDAAPRVRASEGAKLDPLRVPASWARAISTAAERQGISVPQWRREAYRRALVQVAWLDPEMRAALLNAAEPS
jgi:hypothetical protein